MAKQTDVKMEMRNKEITKELRKIEDVKNLDQDFKKGHKRSGRKRLRMSNKGNVTCCQSMKNRKKRSSKLQSLEDKLA